MTFEIHLCRIHKSEEVTSLSPYCHDDIIDASMYPPEPDTPAVMK